MFNLVYGGVTSLLFFLSVFFCLGSVCVSSVQEEANWFLQLALQISSSTVHNIIKNSEKLEKSLWVRDKAE